jgi:hypothetical protein
MRNCVQHPEFPNILVKYTKVEYFCQVLGRIFGMERRGKCQKLLAAMPLNRPQLFHNFHPCALSAEGAALLEFDTYK